MSSETKRCESCKRTLPITFYNVKRSRLTGYAPECKDCSNYRKGRLYRLRAPEDAEVHSAPRTIYPLREHTEKLLRERLNRPGDHFIRATFMSSQEKYLVKVSINDGGPLEIKMFVCDDPYDLNREDDLVCGFAFYGGFSEFLKMATDMLVRNLVRIHSTKEIDI